MVVKIKFTCNCCRCLFTLKTARIVLVAKTLFYACPRCRNRTFKIIVKLNFDYIESINHRKIIEVVAL
jgi:Zn finger protein HypA/HybF involved in hydrogenase expression